MFLPCACGADTWICQRCGVVHCDTDGCRLKGSCVWIPGEGTVCTTCVVPPLAPARVPSRTERRIVLDTTIAQRDAPTIEAREQPVVRQRLALNHALCFMLAGDATVTLRDAGSGHRFTYRIRAPRGVSPRVRFVSLLTGPDNTRNYSYIGTIFDCPTRPGFRWTSKSRVERDAPSLQAFEYVFNTLAAGATLPEYVEIWHEGRCGRCGRTLTVPESIALGIGPECAARMGAA